jgi:hypothetical protein
MSFTSLTPPLQKGDIITIATKYKKRSFWEWLSRKPKTLQRFVITDECKSND